MLPIFKLSLYESKVICVYIIGGLRVILGDENIRFKLGF